MFIFFFYVVYLKIFIIVYVFLLFFVLVNIFYLMSIFLLMFIFFVLLGVEFLGEEIEDFFGFDCNDLFIGDIVYIIKGNVFEIFEFWYLVEFREWELYEKVF